MSKYVAIVFFRDGQDDCRAYRPGDTFPRVGLTVTEARLAELSGSGNARGIPLIREITGTKPDEPEAPAAPEETEKPAAKKTTRKKTAKKSE